MRRLISWRYILIILIAGIGVIHTYAQGTPKTTTVLFPGLTGQQLLDSLVAHYKPATVLSYNDARDTLFSKIYNVQDSLTGVYTGYTIYLDPNADPSTDAANKGINTEHTYPQSKGASSGNARSDMHHLFPVKDNVNSSRGNTPYDDIIDTDTDSWYRKTQVLSTIPPTFINEYSEKDNDTPRFEPREDHKGNAARAVFYFYTMYKTEADNADPNFFNLQKDVLYSWHYQDPVDSAELARTNLIAAYQDGKVNPFVIDTSLVRRAYFSNGTLSPPLNLTFSNVTTSAMTLSWSLPAGYDAATNQLLVLMQSGAAVDDDPTGVGVSSYSANSIFGSGSEVGTGSFAVYQGDGTTVTVTGLTDNTTYYVKIWNTQNDTSWSTTQTSGSQTTGGGTSVQPGDVIISEIMQNPNAVADANGEWFEIYNSTASAIDMNGWIIKDNGTDSHTIANGGALLIAAHDFLVLGNNSTLSTNGGVPVDYQYSGFTLANGADEVILLLSDGITEIDRVEYDGGINWIDPTGASMVFTGTAAQDNNNPAFWVTATTPWQGSAGDKGSPGVNGSDQSLPVLLSSFTAEINDNGVTLRWTTESEVNNLGYEIYRGAGEEGPFYRIADYQSDPGLLGQGNTNQRHEYQYQDSTATRPGIYWYQLTDVDFQGRRTYHGPIRIELADPDIPEAFRLYQNYPNPFNPFTVIHYQLMIDNFVTLKVYDVLGREIKTLVHEQQSAGRYQVRWNGRDDAGQAVSSGVYFYRLRAVSAENGKMHTFTKKMLLLR